MQPKKHYFAHIPTIAIFIVFAMSAPLGVLLFILKSIDKNAEKEEKAAAQAQADYRSDLGPAPAQTAPRQENEPTYGHDVPTKEQKDAKERHKLLTTLCTIGGAVFLFAGFSTLFMDGADSMMEAFTAIAQMLGGGAALLTALRMDRTRKLERLLDKIAGDRDNIPLDELFAAARLLWCRRLHRQPHRYPCGARCCAPAAQAAGTGARTGTSGPVRRPSAAAAAGQRRHS